MRKLRPDQRVDYPTARRRVLDCMRQGRTRETLHAPSSIAGQIWPDHEMRAQGAGLAAVAILKRMESEGLCGWTSRVFGIDCRGRDCRSWGWYITSKGRAFQD